jgi:LysR family transcriptional activator of nhaA
MTWLNYHHLYYFYNIAKETSIANASKKLNVTQSSLSNQLKSLETTLDIALFDRVGRKLVLTDKGKHVYGLAQKIFEIGDILVNEIENNQLGKDTKHFRVGAVSTLSKNIQQMFFSPLIKSKQKLDIFSSDLHSLLDKLRDLEVDLIITNRLPSNLEEKFVAHTIHSFPYCLVSSKKLSRKDVEVEIKEKGVCLPATDPYNKNKIYDYLKDYGDVKKIVKAEIEDTALLRLFAAEEGQLAIIPKIGVYKDLLNQNLFVVDTLKDVDEKFFLIAREESFELMNIDILINYFKNLLFKGDE